MYTFWFTCVTIHFNLKAFHWFIFELCLCLPFFWLLISLNFPFVFRIMSTCYYCYEFNCNPDSCNNYYIFYEYLPWNHKMLGTHSLNEFTWKTNLIFVFGFRFVSFPPCSIILSIKVVHQALGQSIHEWIHHEVLLSAVRFQELMVLEVCADHHQVSIVQ